MDWYDSTMRLTRNDKILTILKAVAPNCNDFEKWANAFDDRMQKNGITEDRECVMFLAQLAHESLDFNHTEESLYYSADRLMVVWPSRFPSKRLAKQYERNPQKLANYVYGGRYGNTGSNDGWLYRGSGPTMLTFKSNFQGFERDTGYKVVQNPDLLRTDFNVMCESAIWFWKKNVVMGDVESVTRQINGGINGLTDRKERFNTGIENLESLIARYDVGMKAIGYK